MGRSLMRLVRWTLILVVAVVVTGLTMLVSIEPEEYREFLAGQASDVLGRPVTIDGPLDLEIALTPVIVAEDVRIANAPGFDTGDLARIGRLEVAAGLIPLLGGQVEIERLVFDDAAVALSRRADGTANYDGLGARGADGTEPADPADADTELSVADLQVTDLTITYSQDGTTPVVVEVPQGRLSARGPSAPVEVVVDARIDRTPVTLNGTFGAFDALVAGTGTSATVNATVGGTRFGYDGMVAADAEPRLDGQITLSAPEEPFGRLGTLELSGRLVAGTERVELTDIDGALGDSGVTGDLLVVLDRDRPLLGGGLTVDQISVPPAAPETADSPLIPDLPLAGLGALGVDVDLGLSIGGVIAPPLEVRDIAAELRLDAAQAELGVASARLHGGTIGGIARLDAAGQLGLRVHLETVELSGFTDRLDGPVSATLAFDGGGATLRQAVADGDGSFEAILGQTTIGAVWQDQIGDALGRVLPLDGGVTRLTCAVGRFDIAGGRLTSTGLIADSAAATAVGEAVIDLLAERLDVLLRPRARDTAVVVPVRIYGPLDDPAVAVDVADALQAVGPDLLLGALDQMAGLAIPLVAPDSGIAGCAAALDAGPAAPVPPADLDGVLDQTRDALDTILTPGGTIDTEPLDRLEEGLGDTLNNLFGN